MRRRGPRRKRSKTARLWTGRSSVPESLGSTSLNGSRTEVTSNRVDRLVQRVLLLMLPTIKQVALDGGFAQQFADSDAQEPNRHEVRCQGFLEQFSSRSPEC